MWYGTLLAEAYCILLIIGYEVAISLPTQGLSNVWLETNQSLKEQILAWLDPRLCFVLWIGFSVTIFLLWEINFPTPKVVKGKHR
jgi:hypothetical protein